METFMKTYAVANQKGGVGKTTTAATLATIWAKKGRRVLAVDMDPQGNLGLMLGVMYSPDRPTIYNVLTRQDERREVADVVMEAADGVDLLPATTELTNLELEGGADMLTRLRMALDELRGEYDICVIDCPPSQGVFVQQALFAADEVIVPTNADLCSVAGLAQLRKTIGMVKTPYMNPSLEVAGIVVTRLNRKDPTEVAMVSDIEGQAAKLGWRLFSSVINHSEPVQKARNEMKTVVAEKANPAWAAALGTKAYLALADEIEGQVG